MTGHLMGLLYVASLSKTKLMSYYQYQVEILQFLKFSTPFISSDFVHDTMVLKVDILQ